MSFVCAVHFFRGGKAVQFQKMRRSYALGGSLHGMLAQRVVLSQDYWQS